MTGRAKGGAPLKLFVMRNEENVMPSYSKLSVATEQLDTALRLYLSNSNYFSVITLAGAAEEILGVFLKRHGQPNAFEEDLKSSLRVYRWLHGEEGSPESMHKTMNRVKNAAKHMQRIREFHERLTSGA